jgi:hypothetical protein
VAGGNAFCGESTVSERNEQQMDWPRRTAATMSDGRDSGLSFRRRIQHFGRDFMETGCQGLALGFPWPYEKAGIAAVMAVNFLGDGISGAENSQDCR